MTEFISITIICIIIYEVLILLSFKKLIVENINIYKKFINLLSNKNIDDNKKEYYFLNTSKLLFITSLKLLFIDHLKLTKSFDSLFINSNIFSFLFFLTKLSGSSPSGKEQILTLRPSSKIISILLREAESPA